MKLCLGVIDVPEPEGNTTYGVGQQLENKYGLFSVFVDAHAKDIINDLGNSLARSLETYMITGNAPQNSFKQAEQDITQRLKDYITHEEMAGLGVAGVPTQAALDGLSLRTKSGKNVSKVRKGQKFKKVYGARRPSFIYSGVFQASLKVWVKE